ncbi:MAG: CvpA family protein [Clostridia bacterium]|nr:CvpA family protein [Clostridia bacterium]
MIWLSVKELCARTALNYAVDVFVLLFLVAFVFICAKRGFVECLFSLLSTAIALFVAVTFAKLLLSVTGGLFGLQGALENGLTGSFAKLEGFNAEVSAQGIEDSLATQNLPAILANLAVKWFGKTQPPEGTTLAMVFGGVCARLLSLLLVGAIIFVLCKVLLYFIKRALNDFVESIVILDSINTALGAGVGLIYGFLIISTLLSFVSLFPIAWVQEQIAGSIFLGWMYDHNLFIWSLGLLL